MQGVKKMSDIVRKCRLCSEPIENSPFKLCSECLADSEQVWHFIKKNPYVSIKSIALSTGIHVEKVERMIVLGKERHQRELEKRLYS